MPELTSNRIYKERKPNFKPFAGQIAFPNYRHHFSYESTINGITKGSDTKKYREIANNPVVSTALDLNINGIFWSGFSIDIQNDYDLHPNFQAIDTEILNCIYRQINNLQNEDFQNILKSMLYNSYVYGFSISEIIWEQNSGYWDIAKIKPKHSYNFNIERDEGGEIEYLEYIETGDRFHKDLLPKFVIATYPYIRGNFYYGESRLAPIYQDVKLWELLEQARATGSQLLAIRPIIHYYNGDREESQLEDIFNAVLQMDSGSVASFEMLENPDEPDQMVKQDEFQVLEDRASVEGVAEIKDILDQIQKRINRHLGIPDDLGMSTSPLGSYAKAKNEMNLFLLNLIAGQEFICNVVNRQIIPAMVKYNYPVLPDKYKLPRFVFDTVEEDYLLKMSQTIALWVQSGVVTGKEKWIRDMLDLPINEEYIPEEIEQQNEGTTDEA